MPFHHEGNKRIGNAGEDIAAAELSRLGCRIIERNFRCRIGEIDIIAEKDGILIFVEVKTRRSRLFGRPSEAVNWAKQRKIIKTSQSYLLYRKIENMPCRFDVVEVYIGPNQQNVVTWIKNAFEVTE